jgi:predicted TIM-barrel fold metal-dependent hydrolase
MKDHQFRALFANCDCQSRRGFLKHLVKVGALSGCLALPSVAQTQKNNASKVIDTHHHFFPPEYQNAWMNWAALRKTPLVGDQAIWSPEKSLTLMDQAGVKKSILSLASTPGLWFDLPPAEVIQLVRNCNDYGADMVKKHPDRYGLFAAVPMVDTESSLKEINYALDTLNAVGIGLQTNYGDKWPGDPVFDPVFKELNRRKAVVYFHPLAAACCGRLNVGAITPTLEVPHDTTRAVVSLLLKGTLAKYRDIKWLFSHAGGTIPMLAGRIDYFYGHQDKTAEFAPNGIEDELRRLYYDTANATHPSSMAALLKLIPSSQVVFGSDYPYVPIDTQLRALDKLDISSQIKEDIKYRNTQVLLKK